MKKHLIDFPENNISIESFYDRLRPCYDSIMQFGDRVLVAQMNWNGMLEGAVYGLWKTQRKAGHRLSADWSF